MSIAGSKFAWAAEGKIVKVRMWNEWFSFDPIIGISGSDFMHAFMSYERLVGYNTGTKWGWHLEAAESIGFDTDTRVRFRLRPGIRWSGGYGEATAEDVKYSIERIAFTEDATDRMEWTQLIEVAVDGPQDGVIVLKAPQANLFSNTLPRAFSSIVCKAAVEEVGGRYTFDPPSISGPYKIGDYSPT